MNNANWPKIAVGAVVLKNDEILLVKRKYPPSAGLWAVPGGHVEPGEELTKTVFRELEEETGLKAESAVPFAITEFIKYDDSGSLKYHYVIIDFLVDVEKYLDPVLNEESLEIGFFKLEDALKLKLTTTTRKIIGALIRGEPTPYPIHHFKTVIYGRTIVK